MNEDLPDELAIKCCNCKGIVKFVVPKSIEDRPTFFHTEPVCSRFNDTNTPNQVTDYLRDCRLALNN